MTIRLAHLLLLLIASVDASAGTLVPVDQQIWAPETAQSVEPQLLLAISPDQTLLLATSNHKLKLLLALLDRPHTWVAVDILRGESHLPDFLAKNPNGKIPLLEFDDGRYLAESNAILNYLAEGTPYLPSAPFERAQVLQWQFFEQYSHEPYIAVARYIARYLGLPPERRAEYEAKQAGGRRALAVLDGALRGRHWLVADRVTIADISLYAYTHVAHEGGFELDEYPEIRAWLARIRSLPGYVGMDRRSRG